MAKRSYVRYDVDELREVVKQYHSLTAVLLHYGKSPVGGNSTSLRLFCRRNNIDISHFTGSGHAKGKPSNKRKSAKEFLVMGTSLDRRQKSSILRRCLLECGVEYKCSSCGLTDWLGLPINLEVDHIDECYWNNELHNLRFLCPTCHSMKKVLNL